MEKFKKVVISIIIPIGNVIKQSTKIIVYTICLAIFIAYGHIIYALTEIHLFKLLFFGTLLYLIICPIIIRWIKSN